MIRSIPVLSLFVLACAGGLAAQSGHTMGTHTQVRATGNATTPAAATSWPVISISRSAGGTTKEAKLSYQLSLLADGASAARAAGRPLSAASAASLPPPIRPLVEAQLLRLDDSGAVQVYIAVDDTSLAMRAELRALGVRIERVDVNARLLQAVAPATGLRRIAALPGVRSLRLPDYPFLQTGSVESEGDAVLRASDLRTYLSSIDGTGITVGVISDGVAGLAESQASGDVPAVDTTTCNTDGGDPGARGAEGTAMLEIVHDLAPGAALMFGNFGFGTGLDFNAAVSCLAAYADIVVDDIAFYGAGPYNGTSYVSANTAAALNGPGRIRGYYTAVGNQAVRHYQGPYASSGFTISSSPVHWDTHRFEASTTPYVTNDAGLVPAPASFDRFRLSPGANATIVLAWSDVWGSSPNDYDLFFGSAAGIFPCSLTSQNGSEDPVESCTVSNSSATTEDIDIYIANYQGSAAPRTVDLFLLCTGCVALSNGTYLDFNTPGSSVGNQADAGGSPASVMAVGAVRFSSPDDIQRFSGRGPTENARTKPDLVGPDAVCVTGSGGFLPSGVECQDEGKRFVGTSAAAPHIAAIAALLLQCVPSLTRLTLRDRLIASSADLGDFGPDNVYGYGRPDVFSAAVAADSCGLPTPTPTPTPTDTATPGPATDTPGATATPTVTPTPRALIGDVTCDGSVNAIDAALILQYAAGLLAGLPCPLAADTNQDGRVDAIDAALVLQFSAGLLPQLP